MRLSLMLLASLAVSAAALPAHADDAEANRCTALQTAGWILGSVGAAGVVVGAVTAGLTFEQQDIHEDHCDDVAQRCDRQGIQARERGETLGAVTTMTWIASGALLAAGLVLVVSGGSDTSSVSLRGSGRAAALEYSVRW